MAEITGYLNIIKSANSGETVRDAIVNCMRDINDDAAVKQTSLIITKADNATYKPGKGKAFKSVTVNIDGSGTSDPSKTISYETFNVTENTENGNYSPQNENTYYDKVNVNIDWDSVKTPANLGESAEMETVQTDPTTGKKYWDASQAGYDYVKRIYISNAAASDLPDYPGGDGSTGPFKVNFWNTSSKTSKSQKIATLQVSLNGDAAAAYANSGKAYPNYGGTFVGWSPNPTKVTQNMDCYAQYASSITGEPLQITDPLEEIMANTGKYNIGNWFLLPIVMEDESSRVPVDAITIPSKTVINGDPEEHNELYIPASTIKMTLKMQLVATGESGSVTTWLAMEPVPTSWIQAASGATINGPACDKNNYGSDDWNSCYLHKFLDERLYGAMPQCVKDNIMQVTKWTWGAMEYPPISGGGVTEPVQKASSNKIWIPSLGEVSSLFSDYENVGGAYAPDHDDPETSGVSYAAGWTPKILREQEEGSYYSITLLLRSMCRYGMYGGTLGLYQHNGDNKVFGINNAEGIYGNMADNPLHIGFCCRH